MKKPNSKITGVVINGKIAVITKVVKVSIEGFSKQVEETEIPQSAIISISRREAFRNWQAVNKLMDQVSRVNLHERSMAKVRQYNSLKWNIKSPVLNETV